MSTAETRANRRDRIARFEAEYQAVRLECVEAWGRFAGLFRTNTGMVVVGIVGMLALIFIPGTIEAM